MSVAVKIVGKIDLSFIPKDTFPVVGFQIKKYKLPDCREDLDSGWGISFKMMIRNHIRYMKSVVKR